MAVGMSTQTPRCDKDVIVKTTGHGESNAFVPYALAQQLENEAYLWQQMAIQLHNSARHIGCTSSEEGKVCEQADATCAAFESLLKKYPKVI